MKTRNLNVNYSGQVFIGFDFSDLPLAAAVLVAASQVDEAADAARLAVVTDPLRALEYERAGTEAKAFAAAGYTGDVPPSVQSWADAAGLSPTAAADSIIVEADAWSTALYAVRAERLKGKQAVAKATTHDEAESRTDEAIAAIRASVEGVGNAA